MSAVGIFFLGCGVTLYHGVTAFFHPHPLSSLGWAIATLLAAFVVEAYVLYVAVKAVRGDAKGRPFFAFMRHEADPSAVAVVLEDSAACLGILFALGGVGLARLTGEPRWDAVASILVGLLLGAVAIWLIARTRHLLVGPAIPKEVRDRIERELAANPLVGKIARLRTRVIDTQTYRVAAEVEFDGDALADKLEPKLREAYPGIESYEDFRAFAHAYADDVVELLGDEVDRLEESIKRVAPRARYLDIEAD
jgi:zinc transporter 9